MRSFAALIAALVVSATASAQTPPPTPPPSQPPPSQPAPSQPAPSQPAPSQPAAAAPTARTFGSDAGIIINQIKPDRTADFELVIGKLKEALQKSQDPGRKQQAASWKVFKAQEPGPNGIALYFFVMDPAVKGADYSVSKILAEAFPAEVKDLYQKFSDAYAGGQNMVNLQLIANLGQP
jgi:pyruvate/2-oxoglutarate dehydrogenase complex dihydrolipoamide acyltransferase (E2) component